MLDIKNMDQIKDQDIRQKLEKVELIQDNTDYLKLLNKFDEFDLGKYDSNSTLEQTDPDLAK